jgi:hypothetical protein
VATRKPRSIGEAWTALWRPLWPAAAFLAITFVPFLVNDFAAFYDDVVRYNAGGAAWTYPISGMGFSALLLALGVIEYRQADFPFAAIEIAVAAPVALWWLRKLWRDPSIPTMLTGYALTLLAFLFFGRYFQGNYLGYILAVFTPVPFITAEARAATRRTTKRRVRAQRTAVMASATATASVSSVVVIGRDRGVARAERESAQPPAAHEALPQLIRRPEGVEASTNDVPSEPVAQPIPTTAGTD